MPLDPMPEKAEPQAVYRDRQGGQLWEAIGYINDPAVILQNVATGERMTEIIGCPNAERWVRLRPTP